MNIRPTLTFGICVAAGIAAGIGLARPAPTTGTQAQPVADAAGAETGANGAAPSGGYGGGGGNDGGGTSGDGSGGQAATVAPGAITIADFAFGSPITVSAGAPVEVTNADGVAHTLTDASGAFDTGQIGGGGDLASFTAPSEPGTYSFICTLHPGMEGTISVTG